MKSHMRPLVVFVVVGLLLCLQIASAGEPDAQFAEELEEFSAKAARIKDVSAKFRQERHTALLKKPLVSTGRVWIKGERTRWETLKPYESITVVDRRDLRIFYPARKIVEVYELGGRLRELAASPIPRMERLREQFRIKPAEPARKGDDDSALTVVLTPLDESLSEHIQRITVAISRETGLASSIEWVSGDGETTRIAFDDVRINEGLGDDELDLSTPPGTKVVRPLKGADSPEGGGS